MHYLEIRRAACQNGVWRAVPMNIGAMARQIRLAYVRQAQSAVGKAKQEISNVKAKGT